MKASEGGASTGKSQSTTGMQGVSSDIFGREDGTESGDEPRSCRNFTSFSEPEVRQVREKGVTRGEVIFEYRQWIKWASLLFKDDGIPFPQSICLVHRQG